jgi:hypothetical protein
MAEHTDAQIRSYLSSNLTKNSFSIFAKLLNIDMDLFGTIMDLLLDYKITIIDISNISDWSREGLTNFVNTKVVQNNAYVSNPNSTIDGQDYVLNTLGLTTLVQSGSINYTSNNPISIFDYTPRVQVAVYNSSLYYRTFSDLQNLFNTSILPDLLNQFKCTSSLTEHFPVTDAAITSLFSGVSETTYDINLRDASGNITFDASGNWSVTKESTVALGVSIYKQIFGSLFESVNYLDSSNLIYLFNRVNDKLSKLEVECVTFNDLVNVLIPNQYVFGMANDLAMDLDNQNKTINSFYINDMVQGIMSLDFTNKLNYSLNRYNFVDFVSKSYYQQINNLSQYNQGLRDVLNVIIGRVNDFKTLVMLNYDLSNRYLMVL